MPPQECQNYLVATNDVRKADGGGDDDTVETTVTCSASCHSPLSNCGRYGSVEDNSYHGYPESMFLVDKTPGTKTDEEGPSRHTIGAKNTSPLIRPRSKEPWYLKWKESNTVMWLGHFAFIAGSICYLQGALVDLAWARFSLVDHVIPDEILEADDDDTWMRWERKNLDKETRHEFDHMREHYWDYSSLFCMLGGTFFVVCGFADMLYYCQLVDMFMIFAGIAGVLSAASDADRMGGVWNFISCHMYLLEAYSMVKRQRQDIDEMGEIYDGYYFFLFSRMCFLGGCLLDVSCLPIFVLNVTLFIFVLNVIIDGRLSRLT
jgi:hypothetical protein